MSSPDSSYKALVFDIDGTAVPVDRYAMPSERLLAAIAAAKPHLQLFAATGRAQRWSAPFLKATGITITCVIGGGTALLDPVTGEILEQSLIPIDTMHQIQAAMKPFSYDVHLGSTPEASRPPTHGLPIAKPQPYLLVPRIPSHDITPLMHALTHIPNIIASPSLDWDGGHMLQITNADATKEHRIKQVLARLGVSREQTIGVGDGDNDIHLFAAVGHRIAMGNASDQLKSIADEVAPPVSEDGLAQIIERYSRT